MTLRAVHAGTGYQYLLRSVATHDADPQGQSLSDYYAAKGTPPGRWIGSGLDGLDSENATAGAVVTEAQMAALYGEGLHPETDEKMLTGTALKDCKLGRSFPLYTGGVDVLDAIAAAERNFLKTEKRRPTTSERSEIAEQVGRPFYTEKFGYEHASGKDVIAWINRERDQVKQAVAGFDFTFSPVKSVSVLWALADEQTSSKIAALHHEAVAETLAWAEDNAIYTRIGKQGIEQVKTRGIIASEFTHFDTRGGDPDLHSHVLLANKVQGPDGRWLSLDSRAIHQMHQAISARYDAILHDKMTRRMGVDFTAHHPQPGKAPIWEIAGIDRRLVEMFSSRRTLARPVFDQLVADYVAKNGRQPSQRASYALWQKAILDTRDAKKPAQSLDEHRAAWKAAAVDRVGAEVVEQIVAACTAAETEASREVFDPEQHTEAVAELAIARVTDARAHFRASHLDTAISTVLKGYRFTDDTELEAAHQAVMNHAMNTLVVPLTPPEPLLLPPALMTARGAGIDRHANAEKYTTDAVLNAETAVLEAARTPVAVLATGTAVDDVLAAHEKAEGWSLNPGQQALAKHLVGVGTLVAAGVGPAGTGKTASMKVVARTWQATGRNVIGLAPSAAAASVLSEDIDAPAHTIDALTFTWRGLRSNTPAKTLSALPIEISPGDMLLVDEAGMASTENLAALTEIAHQSGAVVRLIGDPYQLSAVTSGGLFTDIARTPGTVELEQVMRMGADTEQAEATLGLRLGDAAALDLYDGRGWVTGGHREAMLTDAVQAYLADLEAGRSSLIIASRNADVDTLNEVIRAGRIAEGIVDETHTRVVSRGDTVGVGDTVIARKNSMLFSPDRTPLGRVINGQLFTVTGLAEDGSLAVRDRNTGTDMLIPADYAAKNIHLGYAATIHRSQGATVDTTHAVIDTGVDRAGLYVAMTRGRRENRVYAVCEPVLDLGAEDGHMHSAGDRQAPTPIEVLHTVLARDTRHISAMETLRTEYTEATDPQRLEALYRHGAELAAKAFTAATLDDYLDHLPRAYTPSPELGEEIGHAWTEAVLADLDPRQLWADATDNLEGAESPAAVIAHRLRHHTREAGTGDALPYPAPTVLGADTELAAWLADTRAALQSGDHTPAAGQATEGEPVRSWTATELLTDDELAGALDRARATAAASQARVQHAHEQYEKTLGPGPAELRVREEHRHLDEMAEAINQALPLERQQRQCQDQLRRLEHQQRQNREELAKLGRFAVRRRRELEDTLSRQQAEQDLLGVEEKWIRGELGQVSPDPGHRHTWDHTLARAADAAGRQRELDQARAQDRHPRIKAQEELARQMRQVSQDQAQVEELASESARREAMTAPEREEEHQARQQHLDQKQTLTADSYSFGDSWWADPVSDEPEEDLGYGHSWSNPAPTPTQDHGYGPEL